MLAANLHQFRSELGASVPLAADRERCRQLLGNVEFVQAWTAPRGSALYSRFYSFVAWAVLAGFPVATLVLVQMSSLRYQSDTVTRTQQLWLALDLALLLWFFERQRRWGRLAEKASWLERLSFCGGRLIGALLILIFDLLYLNVPPFYATADQGLPQGPSPLWKQGLQATPGFRFVPRTPLWLPVSNG